MTPVNRTSVRRVAPTQHPCGRWPRGIGAAFLLPLLLCHLSCGGGAPTPPSGPAPAPPGVPRPPAPTRAGLTVDPAVVREDVGATTLTVTATLVGEGTRATATAIALTVDEGTATAADYTATQATLIIAAGPNERDGDADPDATKRRPAGGSGDGYREWNGGRSHPSREWWSPSTIRRSWSFFRWTDWKSRKGNPGCHRALPGRRPRHAPGTSDFVSCRLRIGGRL